MMFSSSNRLSSRIVMGAVAPATPLASQQGTTAPGRSNEDKKKPESKETAPFHQSFHRQEAAFVCCRFLIRCPELLVVQRSLLRQQVI